MKTLLFLLLTFNVAAQTVTSTTVPVNINMVLQGRGTLFFTNNASTLFAVTDPRYARSNALNSKIDVAGESKIPTFYNPTVSVGTIATTSPYQYNHDVSIAWFQDRWFAAWNANTNAIESANGQVNLVSTSTDFITWTTPVQAFISSTYSTNPVTYSFSADVQWQPNLLVVSNVLWCVWSQENAGNFPAGLVAYHSKLTSPTAKWYNQALSLNVTNQGRIYYPFPTQDPLLTTSGRVLAPITWIATNDWGAVNGYSPGFFTIYKLVGAAYTDNGSTWSTGGYTTVPNKPYQPWEPFFVEGVNGTIRIFARNLDFVNASKEDFMLTAQGYGIGEAFAPLESAEMEVSTTRYGHIPQTANRKLVVGPDVKDSSNPAISRQNLALFFSQTGADDLTAGTGLTGYTADVQLYPQGVEKDGKLYIAYSYGPIPRSIKTLVVDPAPSTNDLHIWPRKNYFFQNQLQYVSTAPAHFTNGNYGVMRTVTNTSTSFGTSTNVSAGAWVYLTKIDGAGASIADNRDDTSPRGFLFTVNSSGGLRLVTYSGSTSYNHDSSGITVPTNQWVYLGMSADYTTPQVTFYAVQFDGTVTTSTVALTAPVGNTEGGPLYITAARPSSTVGKLQGKIRRLSVLANVIASANNHRYWHGLDQVALSATDWPGTETNPGTTVQFTATASNAGSNDAAWLLEWSRTGTDMAGSATETTIDGSDVLQIKGFGSAGVEFPTSFEMSGDQSSLSFSFLVPSDPPSGKQIKLLTIGGYSTRQEILIRNAGVVEVYDSVYNQYFTLGSYTTNVWRPINVSLANGAVTYGDPNGGTVNWWYYDAHPRVYLGAGYVNQDQLSSESIFYVRLSDLTVSNGRATAESANRLAGRNSFPLLKIESATPTLSFIDTGVSTNYLISNGNNLYLNQSGASTPGNLGLNYNFVDNSLSLVGEGAQIPRFLGVSFSDTIAPGISFDRSLGTLAAPQTVTNGTILGQILFSGNGLSAKGEIRARANDTWNATNNPVAVDILTTDFNSTTRAVALTITPDRQLQQFATSPTFKVTAEDGITGWRLNVLGGSNALFTIQTNGVTKQQFFGDGSAQFEGNTIRLGGSSGPTLSQTAGNPEAAITAPVGSLYLRNNGGAGSTLYTKETGTGNTGWRTVTPLVGSGSLAYASISAGSSGTATLSLSGANTDNPAIASPQTALTSGLIHAGTRVSSANTLEVTLYNPTGGALGTTNTWNVRVFR